jgi:glycosyltransferase involved in cell wall biosynthesis
VSRVALVVVRFGRGITGGAEMHAGLVGARLAARGHDVTVLTTCAQDYVTWANALPAGETREDGTRVIRFPVRGERDLKRWEAAMQPILQRCWTADDEQTLLREQGPDCPALLDHLRDHGSDYDAVIFFTLLYLPTVAGIPLVWDRAILVPTLHDELSAHLDAQARAIRLARWVMWNSPEEQELANRLYDVTGLRGAVAGVGVDAPADAKLRSAEVCARLNLAGPFLLYAGRVDPDKGCGTLFEHFLSWAQRDDRAELVLAGGSWMDIPAHPRIRPLGFLEPADLWAVMAGAVGTVVPSRNESLSLATLESLASATPVIVTGESRVLVGHARRSGAGLVYHDGPGFARAASLLLDQPEVRAAMGAKGREYVAAEFNWERIMALYDQAIRHVATAGVAA